jgi:hypothetical protein
MAPGNSDILLKWPRLDLNQHAIAINFGLKGTQGLTGGAGVNRAIGIKASTVAGADKHSLGAVPRYRTARVGTDSTHLNYGPWGLGVTNDRHIFALHIAVGQRPLGIQVGYGAQGDKPVVATRSPWVESAWQAAIATGNELASSPSPIRLVKSRRFMGGVFRYLPNPWPRFSEGTPRQALICARRTS